MSTPCCKYHPTEYASWYCPNCKIHSCINCVTDPRGDLFPSCTLCRKTLTSLSLIPIQPKLNLGKLLNPILQIKNLSLILLASILMASVSSAMLVDWLSACIIGIILIPIIGLNFSFMEHIANNEPPSISVKSITKPDNRDILLKFLSYLILVAILLTKLTSSSNMFAYLAVAWIIFGAPSSLIIIMMEKRFFSSFNPVKIFAIVRILSANYIVIFILWLSAVSFLIMPTLALSAETATFFIKALFLYGFAIFLTQWVFGLMGTCIFKNHVELNYSVRSSRRSALKSVRQDPMIEVDIYVQEGRFEDAVKSLWEMVDQNQSSSAYEKLISIYHYRGNKLFYEKTAQQYFKVLNKSNNYKRAAEYYSQMISKGIEFRPESNKLALAMANEMRNSRQVKDAIVLLNEYDYKPNSDNHWDKISFCLAQLEFEFNHDKIKALELVETILKRAVDQEILESAGNYKQVIESH